MENFEKLKIRFKTKGFLDQALTHGSWVNENQGIRGDNQRLEFLGDSVLGFIVADHLYREFPNEKEGNLTNMRKSIVEEFNLAVSAFNLGIGEHLSLGKGELMTGGKVKDSNLADALEAVIGALWLDQGLAAARDFVKEEIIQKTDYSLAGANSIMKQAHENPKGFIQEWAQQGGLPVPEYRVVKEGGPDHIKTFEVEVLIAGKVFGKGEGGSKKEAETRAAKEALEIINEQPKSKPCPD